MAQRLRRAALLLVMLAGCAAPPFGVGRVDTDAGRGDALVLVQGTPAPPPVLVEGYRTVRLIEPDGEPDPPSWWTALGLQDGGRIVVATDAAGLAAARRLVAERPRRVQGVIWLGGPGQGWEAVQALAARHGWPAAQLGAADEAAIARQVAEWLPATRSTFRVLP